MGGCGTGTEKLQGATTTGVDIKMHLRSTSYVELKIKTCFSVLS